MILRDKEAFKRLESLEEQIRQIQTRLESFSAFCDQIKTSDIKPSIQNEERLNALELWKGKIHALLTEETKKNTTRLNRYGRNFRNRIL